MALKYKISELFKGRLPNIQNLYDQLLDLQNQIDEGSEPVPPVRESVKLTKTGLKKAFGDPTEFKSIGIVHNSEGSYLIVTDGKGYKHIALEDI